MSPKEVSEKKRQLRKQLTEVKRAINSTEEELKNLDIALNRDRASYASRVKDEEMQALKKYVEEELHPYEAKLSQIKERISELESMHQKDLDELTEDNLMQQCSSKQDIIDEVRKSVTDLRTTILGVIDEQFLNELENQLDDKDCEIETDDLDSAIAYFNVCDEEIRKISKYNGKLTKFLNWFQGMFSNLDLSSIAVTPVASVVIVVVSILVLLVCYKFVFPTYLGLIAVCIILNILRNYKIFKILLSQKAVMDNVDEIEEKLRQDVLDELDRRTEICNQSYEKNMAKLKELQQKMEQNIKNVSLNAKNSFNFDDSEVSKVYQATVNQKNRVKEELTQKLADLTQQKDQLMKVAEELAKSITDGVAEIQSRYLDPMRMGESYLFEGKFLIDVDKNTPVFFEHPKNSCLFLYSSEGLMQNFLRLMILQIRGQLKATMIVMNMYDVKTLCASFLCCKPKTEKDSEQSTIGRLFSFYTNDADFKKKISELISDVKNKTYSILAEHPNIDAYNDFMIKQESLPIPFTFNFILDPSNQVLNNVELLQVLQSGGKVGTFSHIFMREDEFFKNGDKNKSLIEAIGRIYSINDMGINSYAKEFLFEKFEEQKNASKA